MAVKIAINGFGRIGRCAARIALSRDDVELVAINDTAKRELTRYLLQYDTVHGEFRKKVEILSDECRKPSRLAYLRRQYGHAKFIAFRTQKTRRHGQNLLILEFKASNSRV